MTSKINCCELDNVFGYTLKQGIVIVGVSTLVISIAVLLSSLTFLIMMASKEKHYNTDSKQAIDMIFALFGTSTSMYQIAISTMLVWFTVWHKGEPFVLTLWYGSHLSILPLYCFMFTARTIIYYSAGHHGTSLFTAFAGFIFKGVFIYFLIVVNSYMNSLDPNVVYY